MGRAGAGGSQLYAKEIRPSYPPPRPPFLIVLGSKVEDASWGGAVTQASFRTPMLAENASARFMPLYGNYAVGEEQSSFFFLIIIFSFFTKRDN